ncbi:hypothetical protein E2C01_049195 [Portunus trituberculatus]|uniref:Uncharacterized protein n=1 Tax=Portunus trituberculatus TaxID=210409 RepID=A0A5B7GDA3_PORTR|nr:hypothetical protein [Portunus trituberculatus]
MLSEWKSFVARTGTRPPGQKERMRPALLLWLHPVIGGLAGVIDRGCHGERGTVQHQSGSRPPATALPPNSARRGPPATAVPVRLGHVAWHKN